MSHPLEPWIDRCWCIERWTNLHEPPGTLGTVPPVYPRANMNTYTTVLVAEWTERIRIWWEERE